MPKKTEDSKSSDVTVNDDNAAGAGATEDSVLDDALSRMRDPVTGVKVKARKWMMRSYPDCFVGSEAVDWLVKNNFAVSREDAVQFGRLMQARGDWTHVTRDHAFKDGNLFYRFQHDIPQGEHGHLPEDIETWAQFLPNAAQDAHSLQPSMTKKDKIFDDAEYSAEQVKRLQDINVSPLDEHNVKLLDAVAPPGWVNPDGGDKRYNMVVIGAGAGGLVSAAGSAGLGAKVALIERHMLGGDCLNFGCVPSKALLRCAQAAADVRDAHQFGVFTDAAGGKAADDSNSDDDDSSSAGNKFRVDFGRVMERMRKIRASISDNDSAKRFAEDLGIDVFIGKAKFTGKHTVEVEGLNGEMHTLTFAKAVIAAGARPAVPKIKGLESVGYLTNTTVFNLTELPKTIGVIGTGPIGCELGQAFARLGSKVIMMGRSDQILGREDRDAAAIVQREMQRDGVEVLLNVKFNKCTTTDDGKKKISLNVDGSDRTIECDELLISTGRRANVEDLNLDAAKITTDENGVKVDDYLRTSNSDVFAVGDVCSPYKFTHMADAMARLVIRNALFFGSARVSQLTVPWATFTSPEIAHVGLYEQDLEERGIKFETFTKRFDKGDRGITDGVIEGSFVKIHVQAGTDQILGATIVNQNAGDMISEVSVCMAAKFGLSSLATVIHPYPTQADCIRQLGDEYNRTKLTPTVKILFRKLLAARR